jgi:hypothetical protein
VIITPCITALGVNVATEADGSLPKGARRSEFEAEDTMMISAEAAEE